ncbi:hypothetical protein GQ600_18525 [Phytophthora cactorum]|nr:hypothetical protein GQ600_18525 [Phytophthora cactorum]
MAITARVLSSSTLGSAVAPVLLRAGGVRPRTSSDAECNSQQAIASLLATTQRLQHRGSRSGALGFEREYMEICWSIDKAPGYKEALTPQTKATKAKNR